MKTHLLDIFNRQVREIPADIQLFAAILVLFSLVMLCIAFGIHRIGGDGPETDFYWDYAPAAKSIVQGDIPFEHLHFRGPGYPGILALFGLVFGDLFTAGKIVSLISAIGILTFLFLWLRRSVSGSISIAGVIVLILNGHFFEYSIRAGTDMFFAFLCLALAFLIDDDRPSIAKAGIAGFIAGYAFITRQNGIVLLAVIFIRAAIYLKDRHANRVERASAAILGMLLPVLPWLIAMELNGQPLFYNPVAMSVLETANTGPSADLELFRETGNTAGGSSLYESVRRNWPLLVPKVGRNIIDNLAHNPIQVIGLVSYFAAISGLGLLLLRMRKVSSLKWFGIISLGHLIVLSFVYYTPRFWLPLIPFAIAVAMVLINWLVTNRLGTNKLMVRFIPIIVLGGMLVTEPGWASAINRIRHSPEFLLDFAARQEVAALGPGRLAARKPHLAYLLDCEFVCLPKMGNAGSLIDWMHDEEIDYLYLGSIETAARPALAPLLDMPYSMQELKLISYCPSPRSAIWRLNK